MRRFACVLVTLSLAAAACTASVTGDPASNGSSTTPESPPASTTATTTAATTTRVDAPSTAAPTMVPGEVYLDDRSTITQDDTGARFTTTLGNRIELHLGTCWIWTEPQVTGPAQLVSINYVTDPGFMAWEVLIEEAGVVTITATGTATSTDDDCGSQDLQFGISIDVGSG